MSRTISRAAAMSIAAACCLGSTCLTYPQVEEIVRKSNEEQLTKIEASQDRAAANVLVAGVGIPTDPNEKPIEEAWQQSAAQIEEFIAAHPNEPKLTAPLRLRQSLLFIANEKPNLASAAFEQIDSNDLESGRDRKIYEVHDTLVWWSGIRGAGSGLTNAQRDEVEPALEDLAKACPTLPNRDDDTCRYLERLRMRIALRGARSHLDRTKRLAILEPALQRYAAQFDAEEIPAIQRWHCGEHSAGDSLALRQARWYDYVKTAFDDGDGLCKSVQADCSASKPAWVARVQAQQCQ